MHWCRAYWFILFCRTIQDPSSQILKWRAAPKTVLVIKKIWDDVVDEPFVQLASWLVQVLVRAAKHAIDYFLKSNQVDLCGDIFAGNCVLKDWY